jgi:hypothetical protein
MQQPCKKCGYESPEADKFCRQCGEQILVESEFSSAATLNHGKSELPPPVSGIGTGRFGPSVGDVIAGETERYYYPPAYAPPPVTIAHPPNVANVANRPNLPNLANMPPVKAGPSPWLASLSGFFKGMLLFTLVGVLMVATGLTVFFSQQADRERERRYQADNRARVRSGSDLANDRAQAVWNQMEEALKLIQEASEKAAGAGASLQAAGDKPVDLRKFAYRSAEADSIISNFGNEALSQTSNQNFETIQAYYEREFGKPIIQISDQERRRKKALFQPSAATPVLIKIEEQDGNRGVRITILHTLLRFPRVDDVQSQNLK